MVGNERSAERFADTQVLGGLIARHAVCLAFHELAGQRESFFFADESAALFLRRLDGPVAVHRLRQLLGAGAVFAHADRDQPGLTGRCKEDSFRRLQSTLPLLRLLRLFGPYQDNREFRVSPRMVKTNSASIGGAIDN